MLKFSYDGFNVSDKINVSSIEMGIISENHGTFASVCVINFLF